MANSTTNFLTSLEKLVFATARKAAVSFVIASTPAVVELVQKNYGPAIGVEVAAVLGALGVYRVSNK